MPHTPPPITQMIQILGKQKDCYSLLLDLAQQQRKAIEEENDENLSKVMETKTPLLLKLQALDEEMQPLRQNMSEADRELIPPKGKTLIDEAAQTLKLILAEEEVCARLLNEKKDETFEQMKVFQEAKKGVKGYKDTDGGKPPRFSREG